MSQTISQRSADPKRQRAFRKALKRHIWRESALRPLQKLDAVTQLVLRPALAQNCHRYCETVCGDSALAGDWQSFLEWLWEHREEILKFILTIIALFAESQEEAIATWENENGLPFTLLPSLTDDD
jgi:hypothetical protein